MRHQHFTAALTLFGALACAPATAGTVSFIEPAPMPAASLAELTLKAQLDAVAGGGDSAPARTPAAPLEAADLERAFALASSTSTASPAEISLAIWHVIRTMKALQFNKPLELIDSKVKVVDTITPKVSAVPLPAAMWLLVMGLMGFVGRRFTQAPGEQDGAQVASSSPRAMPMGAQAA